MSIANSQKLRHNASPLTARQGPLRATQQFGLLTANSSVKKISSRRTPTSPPTPKGSKHPKARSLSETGFVSDRISPTSPHYKAELPKVLRAGASLESMSLYLSGQWPKDVTNKSKSDGFQSNTNNYSLSILSTASYTYYSDGVFKKDEYTQTPDDWEDLDSKRITPNKLKLYKRSQSVSSVDNWNLKSKEIKARLQRKECTTRASQASQQYNSGTNLLTTPHTSQPIKIPTPSYQPGVLRGTPGKSRASVEGLNQEVEKLIISAVRSYDDDTNATSTYFECPDGHRAPIPEILTTRSVNTQTPSQAEHVLVSGSEVILEAALDGRSSSQASSDADDSRPQSVSPSFIPGHFDIDEPLSSSSSSDLPKCSLQAGSANSPKPKNLFVRLPPDGAEKIKIVEDINTVPRTKHFLTPSASIRLLPSERSAFQSLLKKPKENAASRSPIAMFEELSTGVCQ